MAVSPSAVFAMPAIFSARIPGKVAKRMEIFFLLSGGTFGSKRKRRNLLIPKFLQTNLLHCLKKHP